MRRRTTANMCELKKYIYQMPIFRPAMQNFFRAVDTLLDRKCTLRTVVRSKVQKSVSAGQKNEGHKEQFFRIETSSFADCFYSW